MNLRTEQQAIEDSIFRVGTVISVKGRTVEVRVDKAKNTSHLLYQGELLRNVSVGGYVKIAKGFTFIVGKVEGEETALDRFQRGKTAYSRPGEEVDRILTLSLLGFFEGCRFERGIKELPLVDNECFLLKKEEFEAVHDFIKKGDEPLTIGSLAFEKSQPVRVGVNTLFASHIGVFGNTGSGKSYTLAKIYRELFIRYCDRPAFRQKSQFVLIDFNGEYVDGDDQRGIIIDPRYKRDYHLSTRSNDGDRYPVLPEVLEDPDFWIVFLEATEKTQMPFLRRAIAGQYVANKLRNEDEFKDLIGHLIYAACTVSDRTMERTIVINFLSEVDDALEPVMHLRPAARAHWGA
jgi:hypothetical protein